MKATRLIIRGIPYKLVRAKGLDIDDVCDLCSLYAVCQRLKDNDAVEPRNLCDMEEKSGPDTFFAVDLEIEKTIKEVMNDEL